MASFFYYATAIAESGLSVVGIRSPYDQPRYQVVRDVAPGIEIRAYAPRVAVETTMQDGNDGEAFGRLFRYITGANTGKHSISMTVPVEEASQAIPMTKPVEQAGSVMRFFLPPSVANAPPHPTDPAVRIVTLPSTEFAVIPLLRFDQRQGESEGAGAATGRPGKGRRANRRRALIPLL